MNDFGPGYACAVRTDGAIVCWGDNSYGQATPSPGTYSQVSAGYAFACGIQLDGTLACWGDNAYGECTPPSGTFVQIDAGTYFACAVRSDGAVVCWGDNSEKQATPPAGQYVSVATGSSSGQYACAIGMDGYLKCWGSPNYTIGITDLLKTRLAQLSIGDRFACGILSDGRMACPYDPGRLPTTTLCPSDSDCFRVKDIPGVYAQVSVGSAGGCGVGVDGTLYCWDSYEMNDVLPRTETLAQMQLFGGSVGYGVALMGGEGGLVGVNPDGSSAIWGSIFDFLPPVPDGTFKAVMGNQKATALCGLRTSGKVVCWGDNANGLANAPMGIFSQISMGAWACGLTTDGAVVCWGGPLATPTETMTKISVGDGFGCGLWLDGSVACWGDSSFATSSFFSYPSGAYTDVVSGSQIAYALGTDGSITQFGASEILAVVGMDFPSPPSGQFKKVAFSTFTDSYYACGIRIDGTVACWGRLAHDIGQLKPPAGEFVDLSIADGFACALDSRGKLWCWGSVAREPI